MDGTQPNADRRKRRSSILKCQRSTRTPFSELEFNVATPTDTAKSRRVSFSRKTGVAEFVTNEATTTWKNFYEEQNKSLETSRQEGEHRPTTSVGHLGNRMFDQQFQEVEAAFDYVSGNFSTNGNLNTTSLHIDVTNQLDLLEDTLDDDKLTMPVNKLEHTSLTEQHLSKVFRDNDTAPSISVSNRIDINFSNIALCPAKDDLDEIVKDLDFSEPNVVCRGPIGGMNVSQYIELDLNTTHVNFSKNDASDMSITSTIQSPTKELSKIVTTTSSTCTKVQNWTDDKENIMINPCAPADESISSPEKVLVFDGKKVKYASVDAIDDIVESFPETSHKKNNEKTFMDNKDLVTDMSVTNIVPATKRQTQIFDSADISMTKCLTVNFMDINKSLHHTKEMIQTDMSMTNVINTKRHTQIFQNNVDADISMTKCLPANILHSKSRQSLPANITLTENSERRQTQIFEGEAEYDISITKCIPAHIFESHNTDQNQGHDPSNIKSNHKRQTHIFDGGDDADISMTRAIPANIIEYNKSYKHEKTDHLADMSVTQALPLNILQQLINFDPLPADVQVSDKDSNITLTQAIPSNILFNESETKIDDPNLNDWPNADNCSKKTALGIFESESSITQSDFSEESNINAAKIQCEAAHICVPVLDSDNIEKNESKSLYRNIGDEDLNQLYKSEEKNKSMVSDLLPIDTNSGNEVPMVKTNFLDCSNRNVFVYHVETVTDRDPNNMDTEEKAGNSSKNQGSTVEPVKESDENTKDRSHISSESLGSVNTDLFFSAKASSIVPHSKGDEGHASSENISKLPALNNPQSIPKIHKNIKINEEHISSISYDKINSLPKLNGSENDEAEAKVAVSTTDCKVQVVTSNFEQTPEHHANQILENLLDMSEEGQLDDKMISANLDQEADRKEATSDITTTKSNSTCTKYNSDMESVANTMTNNVVSDSPMSVDMSEYEDELKRSCKKSIIKLLKYKSNTQPSPSSKVTISDDVSSSANDIDISSATKRKTKSKKSKRNSHSPSKRDSSFNKIQETDENLSEKNRTMSQDMSIDFGTDSMRDIGVASSDGEIVKFVEESTSTLKANTENKEVVASECNLSKDLSKSKHKIKLLDKSTTESTSHLQSILKKPSLIESQDAAPGHCMNLPTDSLSKKTSSKTNVMKKATFTEAAAEDRYDTKTKVIPEYAMREGVKDLMDDLVKPCLDPVQEKHLQNISNYSTHSIQANIVNSSQVDIQSNNSFSSQGSMIYRLSSKTKYSSDNSNSQTAEPPSLDEDIVVRRNLTAFENVIVFDETTPLNNVLVHPLDLNLVHPYEPRSHANKKHQVISIKNIKDKIKLSSSDMQDDLLNQDSETGSKITSLDSKSSTEKSKRKSLSKTNTLDTTFDQAVAAESENEHIKKSDSISSEKLHKSKKKSTCHSLSHHESSTTLDELKAVDSECHNTKDRLTCSASPEKIKSPKKSLSQSIAAKVFDVIGHDDSKKADETKTINPNSRKAHARKSSHTEPSDNSLALPLSKQVSFSVEPNISDSEENIVYADPRDSSAIPLQLNPEAFDRTDRKLTYLDSMDSGPPVLIESDKKKKKKRRKSNSHMSQDQCCGMLLVDATPKPVTKIQRLCGSSVKKPTRGPVNISNETKKRLSYESPEKESASQIKDDEVDIYKVIDVSIVLKPKRPKSPPKNRPKSPANSRTKRSPLANIFNKSVEATIRAKTIELFDKSVGKSTELNPKADLKNVETVTDFENPVEETNVIADTKHNASLIEIIPEESEDLSMVEIVHLEKDDKMETSISDKEVINELVESIIDEEVSKCNDESKSIIELNEEMPTPKHMGINPKIQDQLSSISFLGKREECIMEECTDKVMSFLLLYCRIRLSFVMAGGAYVDIDTPITAITVEQVTNYAPTTLAALTLNVCCVSLRRIQCSSAGAVAIAIRRARDIAAIAGCWGRQMEQIRLRIAFKIDGDRIVFKVANMHIMSIWEVSLRVAATSPPAATCVTVRAVLPGTQAVDVPGLPCLPEPGDWRHVMEVVWKVFRYLKNYVPPDNDLDVRMSRSLEAC